MSTATVGRYAAEGGICGGQTVSTDYPAVKAFSATRGGNSDATLSAGSLEFTYTIDAEVPTWGDGVPQFALLGAGRRRLDRRYGAGRDSGYLVWFGAGPGSAARVRAAQ